MPSASWRCPRCRNGSLPPRKSPTISRSSRSSSRRRIMAMNVSAVLTQIDDVLQQWRNIRGRSAHDDCSDLPDHETAELVGKLTSTLDRLAPQGTHHRRNLDLLFKKFGDSRVGIPSLVGAVNALRSDYQNAYLQTFEELVHASMFSGFLDMAEHL